MVARMCAALFALAPATTCAQQLDEGWWVVVGSIPESADSFRADSERVHEAVSRCGFTALNDFSAKFTGFRPGYHVFVVGAFASEADANVAMRIVTPCVPDAYLRHGRYLGE